MVSAISEILICGQEKSLRTYKIKMNKTENNCVLESTSYRFHRYQPFMVLRVIIISRGTSIVDRAIC